MTIGTIPASAGASRQIGPPDAAILPSAAPTLPSAFLWLVDAACLIVSFYGAYFLAPPLKVALLAPDSPVSQLLVDYLAPQIGEHRHIPEVAWMLFLMWGATVLTLQGAGGYRPLLSQSRTRLFATAVLAPCLGLSAITLVLFALREPGWSRLFVFLFTAFSAVSLALTRGGVRAYRSRRRAAGSYARTIAFVGSPAAVRVAPAVFREDDVAAGLPGGRVVLAAGGAAVAVRASGDAAVPRRRRAARRGPRAPADSRGHRDPGRGRGRVAERADFGVRLLPDHAADRAGSAADRQASRSADPLSHRSAAPAGSRAQPAHARFGRAVRRSACWTSSCRRSRWWCCRRCSR